MQIESGQWFMASYQILAAALLLSPLASGANAAMGVSTLPSVEKALDEGRSVSVALDLGQCQPGSNDSKPTKTRGGLRINAYRVGDDGSLAFSDDHFTIDRDGKPIHQFLRYRVRTDGSAEFSMTVFSVPDFHQSGATLTYRCAINQGMRFVASR